MFTAVTKETLYRCCSVSATCCPMRCHSACLLVVSFRCYMKVKVTLHTTKYGDPYSEFVLCIYPILSAHTHSSEYSHTVNTHPEHLCCGARRAVGGSVPCSRAPQSWYWGWRERCTFTPPTNNSCQTWDSNSQPFDYESDSLTIRPRLGGLCICMYIYYSFTKLMSDYSVFASNFEIIQSNLNQKMLMWHVAASCLFPNAVTASNFKWKVHRQSLSLDLYYL